MRRTFIQRVRYGYFSREKQTLFLEDLSRLLEDNVPVHEAIGTIQTVSKGIIERVATHIILHIAQGKSLADGMQAWFERTLVATIRAGEANNTLIKTLKAVTYSCSQQMNFFKNFLRAIAAPAFILITIFLIVIFIKLIVFDRLATTHSVTTWPYLSRAIYQCISLIERWGWLPLAVAIGAIYFVLRILQHLTGEIRTRLDKLPLIAWYRKLTAARFMETLGLLIANGIALKEALSIMHRDATPYLSWHLLKMEFALNGHQHNMADALDTQLIEHNDIIRLRTLVKNKSTSYALIRIGQQTNQRIMKTTRIAGKFFGGLLLFLSTLIAISVGLAIYSVNSTLTT